MVLRVIVNVQLRRALSKGHRALFLARCWSYATQLCLSPK